MISDRKIWNCIRVVILGIQCSEERGEYLDREGFDSGGGTL